MSILGKTLEIDKTRENVIFFHMIRGKQFG